MNFPLLKKFYADFAHYLAENQFSGCPETLYDSQNYILNLGGKRVRPIALLASLAAFQDDLAKGYQAALVFEVFHTFTLIHDDIMDNSPKRRGQPTVHEKYGLPTAILAGDNMLLYSYKYLARYPAGQNIALIELLTNTGILICEGQFMDMQFEKMQLVKDDEYVEMITLKTAVLLGACLRAGAIIGGGNSKDQENLYQFGVHLGISFQIMDDILDAFSDDEAVGKRKGGDIIANKKTLLLINAMVLANTKQLEKLNYWLSLNEFDDETKISSVLDIFSELNIRELAEEKMQFHYDKAMQYLSNMNLPANKANGLNELALFLKNRSF